MDSSQPKFEKYPVFLYNSLKNQREQFHSVHSGMVGMYVCGPTVYGDPHLGHARSAVTFDLVFRYFRFLGYKVRYVRNITDVGHLEDEVNEEGEDKIAKKARLEKLEPMEVVQYYTTRYRNFMAQLNILPPSIESTATGHIIEQIQLVEKILENGWAYEVDGSVYFDLEAYTKSHSYGDLSGKVLEELQVASRSLDGQTDKRGPHDFALWKHAKPEHLMKWPSPWGWGFPGWHIECTAMSTKYLGIPFDIHGGGLDLQFPHHEAEIAQCVAATGKSPANYWMHNNMLTIDGQKMSKSLGNFITLEQMFSGEHPILEQAYSPTTVRFFMLQAHYRSPVDFSNSALQAAEKGMKRLMEGAKLLSDLSYPPISAPDPALDKELTSLIDACYQEMGDDFNTAKVLAVLFEINSKINSFYHGHIPLRSVSQEVFEQMGATYLGFIQEVLGLETEESGGGDKVGGLVELLINMRHEARKNKDFATSDRIRDELKALGIQLKDEKGGHTSYVVE